MRIEQEHGQRDREAAAGRQGRAALDGRRRQARLVRQPVAALQAVGLTRPVQREARRAARLAGGRGVKRGRRLGVGHPVTVAPHMPQKFASLGIVAAQRGQGRVAGGQRDRDARRRPVHGCAAADPLEPAARDHRVQHGVDLRDALLDPQRLVGAGAQQRVVVVRLARHLDREAADVALELVVAAHQAAPFAPQGDRRGRSDRRRARLAGRRPSPRAPPRRRRPGAARRRPRTAAAGRACRRRRARVACPAGRLRTRRRPEAFAPARHARQYRKARLAGRVAEW